MSFYELVILPKVPTVYLVKSRSKIIQIPTLKFYSMTYRWLKYNKKNCWICELKIEIKIVDLKL